MARHCESFYFDVPVTSSVRSWGIHVISAGQAVVPPGSCFVSNITEARRQGAPRGNEGPGYCLLHTTEGEIGFESAATGKVCLKCGDTLLLKPGAAHRFESLEGVSWSAYWVEFGGTHATVLMNRSDFSAECHVVRPDASRMVEEVFSRFVATLRQNQRGHELLLGSMVMEMAAALLLRDEAGVDRHPKGSAELISQARNYIEQHPSALPCMEELAAKVHLSYSSFRRLFKAHTGRSPAHYALETRLQRAGDMLLNTRMPVGQIASQAGFQSLYYFSRAFKKHVGMSPRDYRQRLTRNPAYGTSVRTLTSMSSERVRA